METRQILRDLVNFNTINDYDNKKIINYIEKYLNNIGFITEYKSKNLVMSINDNCPIGFLGHTDTVSYSDEWTVKPFSLKERGNKLYGLGVCDMKGSIATMLSVVAQIDWSKKSKGIKLFFTFDEEIGFSGITELIKSEMKFPNYMIIGEPTNNEIVNASKGLLELKVSFRGVSSHSSKPEEGVNAIENCIAFIQKMQNLYVELKKEVIESKAITMNIGLISGGTSINIVPNYCEVCIDFRTITKYQNEFIVKQVESILQDFDAKFEVISNIRPFQNNAEKINMSDFISEASFIDSENKYILGVGPITAHKADEFITISSLEKLEKQYLNMIEEKLNEVDIYEDTKC